MGSGPGIAQFLAKLMTVCEVVVPVVISAELTSTAIWSTEVIHGKPLCINFMSTPVERHTKDVHGVRRVCTLVPVVPTFA